MAPTKSKAKTGTSSSAPETPEVSDAPSQASKVKALQKLESKPVGSAEMPPPPPPLRSQRNSPSPSPAERSKGKAKVAAPILSGEDACMGSPSPPPQTGAEESGFGRLARFATPEDDEPTEPAKKSPSPQASSPPAPKRLKTATGARPVIPEPESPSITGPSSSQPYFRGSGRPLIISSLPVVDDMDAALGALGDAEATLDHVSMTLARVRRYLLDRKQNFGE
ncbi:hypothetical protein BC834DRAFT_977115 [Gloeopeniophorella convolvens]|nr:hypothetical protein BC834DRAFT_977115 [Gloeopeniophorella convolvens]